MKIFGTVLALGLMVIGAVTGKMFDDCHKKEKELEATINKLTERINELENKAA